MPLTGGNNIPAMAPAIEARPANDNAAALAEAA
jgi:hypothetical protein